MKQLLLIVCCVPLILFAQPDSSPSSSADTWYHHDPMGYMQPEKDMLSLNIAGLFRQVNRQQMTGLISIGYERKVRTLWSLHGEVVSMYLIRFGEPHPSIAQTATGVATLAIGPRFYYQQKNRITYGRQVSNLVGSYIGLNIGTRMLPVRPDWNPANVPHYFTDNVSIVPHLGWQLKILKHGFVDIRLGLKAAYGDPKRTRHFFPKDADKFWQILPVSRLRAGLAF